MDWRTYFEREETQAHLAVQILGDATSAKAALDDLARRRAEGQDAVIWKDGQSWFVGPRPPDDLMNA